MTYIENPKLKGSGLLGAIPQRGQCPVRCADCFFQSGRSFLEPLDEHTPNVPDATRAFGRVVRMNDGNDSNNEREKVVAASMHYQHRFFNTSIPKDLGSFPGPVVLTLNPAGMTDARWHKVNPVPPNLMMVRFRANTWNIALCDEAVAYYTRVGIPVVLTFMAYYTEGVRSGFENHYSLRKRTLNSYHVITPDAWRIIVERYANNPLVDTCGKDSTTFSCARCGTCLKNYFACEEKIREARQ